MHLVMPKELWNWPRRDWLSSPDCREGTLKSGLLGTPRGKKKTTMCLRVITSMAGKHVGGDAIVTRTPTDRVGKDSSC